jgi:MFS family permease
LNYGVLFTAWGAAGILGPGVAGRIFDRFGDYRYAFYAAAAFAVIAFVALLNAKPPALQRTAAATTVKEGWIPAGASAPGGRS